MHSIRLLVALCLSLGMAMASAGDGEVAITEPRNAAAGFAVISWMSYVNALGKHCSGLPDDAGTRSRHALESWQQRNAAYVDAALTYTRRIEEQIERQHGQAARQQFHDQRADEFVAGVHKGQAVWFPDAAVTQAGCLRLSAAIESSQLDLNQHSEFFPILEQLKTEFAQSSKAPA